MDPVKAVVLIVVVGAARIPVRRAKVETDPNIISCTTFRKFVRIARARVLKNCAKHLGRAYWILRISL
jgi:hypothetical protein